MLAKVQEVRKALVAVVTFATALLAANVLPANVAGWVATAVGVLGVFGVYATPNVTTAPMDPADPLTDEGL